MAGCRKSIAKVDAPMAQECYELLKRVPPMDRELLGLVRPEQLILFAVPVPPVCIRPTVHLGLNLLFLKNT